MKTNMKTNQKLIAAILALALVSGAQAASWLPSSANATNVLSWNKDSYGGVHMQDTNAVGSPGQLYFIQGSNAETMLVLGVVQWRCPTGYTTWHNPLVPRRGITKTGANCAVTNLLSFTNSPVVLYSWDLGTSNWVTGTAFTNGTWSDPNYMLLPNRPLFVGNFSGQPFTNHFRGLIPTGDFTNSIVPGWNFLCSQIYKDGYLVEDSPTNNTRGLNMPSPHSGDKASLMLNGSTWNQTTRFSNWTGISGWDVSAARGPLIKIGQCFMYYNNTSTTNNWVQGAHY